MTRIQIRIGELAQLCGVNTRTVDYYTRLGLIDAVSRTGGNYRLYEPAAVERLTAIKRLQAQRYSLNEIREQLAGRSSGSSVATIEEIRGELEAIERKLRSVEGAFDAAAAHPHYRGTASAAATAALACALTVSARLQEIAMLGVTPP